MKTYQISQWAAKNTIFAVIIIVLLEFSKLGIGVYLGMNALPRIPLGLLHIVIIGIVGFIWATAPKDGIISRKVYSQRNLVVFGGSFLLAILIGNRQAPITHSTANEYAHATEYTGAKAAKMDSLIKANSEQSLKASNSTSDEKATHTKRRIGYFFLFLLAMGLTFFLLALSCSLACSSYGLFAALAFLLTIGVFSGGLYFLIGLIRKKPIKKFREMSKEEKRKERRRYFKTLLGTSLGLAFLIIFQAVISSIQNP